MESLADFQLKAQPGYQPMSSRERTHMELELENRVLFVRYFWLLRRKEQHLGIRTEKTERYIRMSIRMARVFKEALVFTHWQLWTVNASVKCTQLSKSSSNSTATF